MNNDIYTPKRIFTEAKIFLESINILIILILQFRYVYMVVEYISLLRMVMFPLIDTLWIITIQNQQMQYHRIS